MPTHNQIVNDAEFIAAGRAANVARIKAIDEAHAVYHAAEEAIREARDAALDAAQAAYQAAEKTAYEAAMRRLAG